MQTRLRCNHVMIPTNTTLPASKTSQFRTIRDGQRAVVVEMSEGGDRRGRDGTHIGRCILRGLPEGLPAGSPINVTFRYDRDGLIYVGAEFAETGQKRLEAARTFRLR
ncbi:MAG: Hsp70 family protein [Planctomycetota bacterium]